MAFKKLFSVFFASTLLLFLGCAYLIQLQVKLQDVITLANSASANVVLPIDVKVRFQMSTADQCNKEKENLSSIMSKYYKEIKEFNCTTEEMSTFLDVLAITTAYPVKTKVPKDQIYMIGILVEKTGSGIDVLMRLDKDKFTSLNAEIKEKYMQDIKLENVKLSINVQNNTNSISNLRIYHAFVNSKPYPTFGDFSLKPDTELNIQISDVTRQYINDNGSRRIFEIRGIDNTSNNKTNNTNDTNDTNKIEPNSPTNKSYSDDDSIIIE